jgi:hypothetical protein
VAHRAVRCEASGDIAAGDREDCDIGSHEHQDRDVARSSSIVEGRGERLHDQHVRAHGQGADEQKADDDRDDASKHQ